MTGDSIIIVGGGVIGLSIAYQLAKDCKKRHQKPIITVLEARPATFEAASSHNTGCLHYAFHDSFGMDLTALGRYSFKLWEDIANSDSRFGKDSGYRPQPFFPVMPGDGEGTELLPDWVDARNDWDVDWGSKGQVCATMYVAFRALSVPLDLCSSCQHVFLTPSKQPKRSWRMARARMPGTWRRNTHFYKSNGGRSLGRNAH